MNKNQTFECFSVLNNDIRYSIKGNMHTLNQIYKRKISGNIVKSMVKKTMLKMECQKTYAVINGSTKLLILRINETKFFLITCLIDRMILKRHKAIIINVTQDTI